MNNLEQEFQNLGLDEGDDNFMLIREQHLDENQNPVFVIGVADDEEQQEDAENAEDVVPNLVVDEDDEESDDDTGEPTHLCLVCSEEIPISTSLVHKRDCYYHEDNYTCPFCRRRRRDWIMADHISKCSKNYRMHKYELSKIIFLFWCSEDVVELSLRRIRDNLEDRYKQSLHSKGENPLTICMVCNNNKQHSEGLCLHTLIGNDFKWRAERLCENEIYTQYQNYLELTKRHILYSTRKRYEKRFNTANREEREKMDTLQNVLDKRARNADRKMEELMNTKKNEVNQIIRRHMKILGNRTTWYRDYYIVNILYPSMGIHVDS